MINLFTKWLEVDSEREGVASGLLVALTFGKVKAKSQQRHRQERWEFPEFGRLHMNNTKKVEKQKLELRASYKRDEYVAVSVPDTDLGSSDQPVALCTAVQIIALKHFLLHKHAPECLLQA